MAKFIQTAFKKNPVSVIMLGITFINILIGLVLFAITYQLRPVVQDLSNLTEEVNANILRDDTQHPTFVTHDELKGFIDDRFKSLEGKVDEINRYLRGVR